ncbi:MAG: dihydrofolate reductase [Myxococcota bacterium]|nr:dihydrofolate reductase [Myxococcota bacterium]
MRVSLVVAASENSVIGAAGGIPWKLPDDQQIFKKLTLNHCILMGRKTHESIGRLLPKRTTIVLSKKADYTVKGAHVVDTLLAAESIARDQGEEELFVIGGEGVYALALPEADRIYMTRVHAEFEGDAYMPAPRDLTTLGFERMSAEHHKKDERNEYDFTFECWQRTVE